MACNWISSLHTPGLVVIWFISNLVQYFHYKADFGSVNTPSFSATLIIKFIKYKLWNETILLRQDVIEIKVEKVCFPTIFLQLSSSCINIYYYRFWFIHYVFSYNWVIHVHYIHTHTHTVFFHYKQMTKSCSQEVSGNMLQWQLICSYDCSTFV